MKIRTLSGKARAPRLGVPRTLRSGVRQVRVLRRDQHGRIVTANGRFCYEWVAA